MHATGNQISQRLHQGERAIRTELLREQVNKRCGRVTQFQDKGVQGSTAWSRRHSVLPVSCVHHLWLTSLLVATEVFNCAEIVPHGVVMGTALFPNYILAILLDRFLIKSS